MTISADDNMKPSSSKDLSEHSDSTEEPTVQPINGANNQSLGHKTVSLLTSSLELILALIQLAIHAGLFAVTAAHNAIPDHTYPAPSGSSHRDIPAEAQEPSHTDEPGNYTCNVLQPQNVLHDMDTMATAITPPTPTQSIPIVQPAATTMRLLPEAINPSSIQDSSPPVPITILTASPSSPRAPITISTSSPSSPQLTLIDTNTSICDDDKHGLLLEALSPEDYNISVSEIEEIMNERGHPHPPPSESISTVTSISSFDTDGKQDTPDHDDTESICEIITLSADDSDSQEHQSLLANPASPVIGERYIEPSHHVRWGFEHVYEFDQSKAVKLDEEHLGMQHKEHLLPIRDHGCRQTQPSLENGVLAIYDNVSTTKHCIYGFHWYCDKPSRSSAWYPVTRGKRVGVFDNWSVLSSSRISSPLI